MFIFTSYIPLTRKTQKDGWFVTFCSSVTTTEVVKEIYRYNFVAFIPLNVDLTLTSVISDGMHVSIYFP